MKSERTICINKLITGRKWQICCQSNWSNLD